MDRTAVSGIGGETHLGSRPLLHCFLLGERSKVSVVGDITLARLLLIGWLCAGVVIGPNVCCCSLAELFKPKADTAARQSCCCSLDVLDSPIPAQPNHDDRCHCKEVGKQPIVSNAQSSDSILTVQWLKSLAMGHAAVAGFWLTSADVEVSGSFCSTHFLDHGASARERCPILRC